MNKSINRFLLCSTAFASMAMAAPAMAEEADNDATSTADIIVTARRVEERLQDVPISITVFNQEQLTNRNIVNAADLAAFTPSLSANPNFGSDNSTFAIRGFVQDIGSPPSVGVYFADVVAPRGGAMGFPTGDGAGPGSMFDLQNVQVLKGPQGTLQGRNTTGGAVMLVPQKPTRKFEGYVEGSIGNYDMRRLQAVVNAPISDTVRIRLGLDHQTRDGYLINKSGIGPRDFADINYIAARASMVVDLTPDLENYTIFSYSDSDTHGPASKLIAIGDTTQNPHAAAFAPFGQVQILTAAAMGEGFYDIHQTVADPYSKVNQWQAINTTTWKASDTLTVKNIVSYAKLQNHTRTAQFGTDFSLAQFGFPYNLSPIAHWPISYAQVLGAPGLPVSSQSTFTEELQFQGRTSDDKLTWQAGAYFESSGPIGLSGVQNPSLAACSDPANYVCFDILGSMSPVPMYVGSVGRTTYRSRTRDIGLYTQATYNLTEKLKVTGGFRYTWDKMSGDSWMTTQLFPYPGSPTSITFGSGPSALTYNLLTSGYQICTRPNTTLADGCHLYISKESQKPTWLLGLDFKPTEDILLYAKYSRGYRSGGVKPDAPVQFLTFEPEKVDTYEAGVKASFRGAVSGTFNLTGFYNNFSNQQLMVGFIPVGPVTATAGPVNAGTSRIYGLEAEASITPFKGFVLSASYAYLNTKVKSAPNYAALMAGDPYYFSSGFVVAGDKLALSPEHKLVLNANYTLPLDESIGRITLGATYAYTAKQISNYGDRGLLHYDTAAQIMTASPSSSDLGTVPATNVVNLNLNWNSVGGTPIDLSLFATNVTKQRYYTYTPGLLVAGFETANLGEPRMYGARVKIRFGAK